MSHYHIPYVAGITLIIAGALGCGPSGPPIVVPPPDPSQVDLLYDLGGELTQELYYVHTIHGHKVGYRWVRIFEDENGDRRTIAIDELALPKTSGTLEESLRVADHRDAMGRLKAFEYLSGETRVRAIPEDDRLYVHYSTAGKRRKAEQHWHPPIRARWHWSIACVQIPWPRARTAK